jgi:hypothetical protein
MYSETRQPSEFAMLETQALRLNAEGRRPNAGGWRLEAGGWRLEAGGWRLEAGGCNRVSATGPESQPMWRGANSIIGISRCAMGYNRSHHS